MLSPSAYVSPWVMLFGYGPLSIGELMINSLGLAAIARYVPARISAFMAGCYYVLIGFAMYVGSIVANMAAVDNASGLDAARTLMIYGGLFRTLAFMAGAATVVFALLLPVVRRWEGPASGHGGPSPRQARVSCRAGAGFSLRYAHHGRRAGGGRADETDGSSGRTCTGPYRGGQCPGPCGPGCAVAYRA
ncbi:hypothetical protein RAA17_11950 [Komagataeibacter rhaeticus]|nr:hypothetical protein [Komagataeibacter rhaeticus]